jgi:acetylglutamate kinase
MEFTAVVNLDFDQLAVDITHQLDNEEILRFIMDLDTHIGDWSFTEMIYEWAREQHKEYLAEKEDMEREMRSL